MKSRFPILLSLILVTLVVTAPAQVKSSRAELDATSNATVTSEAIINATAKALANRKSSD